MQIPYELNKDEDMSYYPEVIITVSPDNEIIKKKEKYPEALVLYLLNKDKFYGLGAGNLYDKLQQIERYQYGKKYSVVDVLTTLDSNNPDKLFTLLFLIMRISTEYRNGLYGNVLRTIRENKNQLNSKKYSIKQHDDKKNVKKLLEKVVNAYENGDNTIKDFLNLVNECNLVDEEYMQEILGDEEYAEVLQVHLHEFHDLVKYLNDPHISTQHGVKGESHDTVLFIAANSSRDPVVNISKFFDLWSAYEVKLSEFESFYYPYKNMLKDIECNIGKKVSDMKKNDYVENEENIIQKVNSFLAIYEGNAYYQALLKPKFEKFMKKRNVTEAKACLKENLVYGALSAYKLFYVGCSRARKNLSVIINKQDILGFEDRLINKFESYGFHVIDYTKMKQ